MKKTSLENKINMLTFFLQAFKGVLFSLPVFCRAGNESQMRALCRGLELEQIYPVVRSGQDE